MKRMAWSFSLFVLVWLGIASTAMAISIGFSPSSQAVEIGDSLTVDVIISGLSAADEIVSAYDLDVSYDAALLLATGVTFGPYLDDLLFPGFAFQEAILASGLIDLAELSILSDDELALQQGDSLVLATLHFNALALGTSPLTFTFDDENDIKGRKALELYVEALGADVTVTAATQPVPEPSTLLMLGFSLLIPGCIARRRARKK
ncbi:MAG: cohesin domain-containing protein [Desulfobacteraceae bacterium]|nr:cohesin domain-containing protein [Desulfobacteraceae bacterium]